MFSNSCLDTLWRHKHQNISSINFSCNSRQGKEEEKREIWKIFRWDKKYFSQFLKDFLFVKYEKKAGITFKELFSCIYRLENVTAPLEVKLLPVLEHCFITRTVGTHVGCCTCSRTEVYRHASSVCVKEASPYVHSYSCSTSCNSKICKQTWIMLDSQVVSS